MKSGMRVTLINPRLSGNQQVYYLSPVKFQPLGLATVAGLLPSDTSITLFDDRFETINYDAPADWVGISVDTYSAKRAYQIAAEYRKRKVPVVLGGYHPTLVPEEAELYADTIVVGEAENLMDELLADMQKGCLKKRYESQSPAVLGKVRPRRDIFNGKAYPNVHIVEFGRGCKYRCGFCCIHLFHKGRSQCRPIEDVVDEIRNLPGKTVIFADDNLVNNYDAAKRLFKALIPLKIRWGAQVPVDVAKDPELLSLMKQSGCYILLIGFESLNSQSLRAMKKGNRNSEYDVAVKRIRSFGITIHGSFIWGYDSDTEKTLLDGYQFAMKYKFFMAGFNHLVPSPGTDIYNTLKDEGRLLYDKWWLEQEDYFGSVAFEPKNLSPDELAAIRFDARRKFYSIYSILLRFMDLKTHWRSPIRLLLYILFNITVHRIKSHQEKNALPSRLKAGSSAICR